MSRSNRADERIFLVYIDKRGDNRKVFYVGKGMEKRLYVVCRDNKHWMNIVGKGRGYSREVVKSNLSEKEAFDLEAKFIKKYGRKNLCNQTDGGDGSVGISDETRRKMSLARLGKKLSSETCSRMSESRIGKGNPFYGRKHSEETKLKMSKNRKGKVGRPAGWKHTKESLLKMSSLKNNLL